MRNTDEQQVRESVLGKLAAEPESYLAEYTGRFGNVFNADDAATLFEDYNRDRAKYRAAVHPAATWIRDELFRCTIGEPSPEGKNRVVFTAGGNATGKSTAIEFSGARWAAQAVLDSTFASPKDAQALVKQALANDKRVSILYVTRPLAEALHGMLERSEREGRLVNVDQMIASQRGAAETVRDLWEQFARDPRFQFRFVDNSGDMPHQGTIELAAPRDYTGARETLNEILDAEYRAGRISENAWSRVRGRGDEGEPSGGGQGSGSGGGRTAPALPTEALQTPAASSLGETPADQTDIPAGEPARDTGPTYIGTGIGASCAQRCFGGSHREQMTAGEKIRGCLTWSAISGPRHHLLEFESFIDDTHPFLQEVDGIPVAAPRQAQCTLAKPNARERVAARLRHRPGL